MRRWPYLVFGPLMLAALVGIVAGDAREALVCAGLVGLTSTVTFTSILALPALLSRPEDVHRTAAGTFTISFTMGVIVPIVSGVIWDLTGQPALTFLPMMICTVVLVVFGLWAITYRRHAHDS